MAETKFKVGDRVIVTGDTMLTHHCIDAGSEAVILKIETDGASPEYLTSVQHTPEQALDMAAQDSADHEFWSSVWVDCEVEWVREEDLTLNYRDDDKIWMAPVDEIEEDDGVDVANQSHYTVQRGKGHEPIDVIRSQGLLKHYAHGNVIKYILRAQYKNGVEDLRKARVYLDWLIEAWEDDGDG